MKRTFFAPLSVFLGLVGSMVLMAQSNIFTPIIQFIHNRSITPLQASGCLLFIVVGFAVCYFLLNILCGHFVPRMGEGNEFIQKTRTHGGDQRS